MEPPGMCCKGLEGGGCGWRERGPQVGSRVGDRSRGTGGGAGKWVGLDVPSLRVRAWVHGCQEAQPG